MSDSSLAFCIRAVPSLMRADGDAVTRAAAAYTASGMPAGQASVAAVDDLVASLEADHDEILKLLRAQHPQCFVRADDEADTEVDDD